MRVLCEAQDYSSYVEGEIIRGEDDLEGTFSVRCDDGEILHLNGWLWRKFVMTPHNCQNCGKDYWRSDQTPLDQTGCEQCAWHA
jgi:hypothetical protein